MQQAECGHNTAFIGRNSAQGRKTKEQKNQTELVGMKSSLVLRQINLSTRSVHTLVLLRHGESLWNKEKRFTGWSDVPLTQAGEAGNVLLFDPFLKC
jgi:hypothetical protein